MKVDIKCGERLTIQYGRHAVTIVAGSGDLELLEGFDPTDNDRVLWTTREGGSCRTRNYWTSCTLPECHKGEHEDYKGNKWGL